ncbi:MAG: cache domain-containing protein [Acidobacteriota bacterium]
MADDEQPNGEAAPKKRAAGNAPKKATPKARSATSFRFAMTISVIVVAVLLTAYYMYVSRQRAYFTNRNLRLLSSLGAQVSASLDTHQGFVRNYARSATSPAVLRRARPELMDTDLAEETIDSWLPDFDRGAKRWIEPDAAESGQPPPVPAGGDVFARQLSTRNGEWWVDIRYAGQPETLAAVGLPRDAPAVPATIASSSQQVEKPEASGGLRLSRLLDPLLKQELVNVFDEILVARSDGTVMYSYRPAMTSDVMSEVAAPPKNSGAELLITRLDALQERKGWRQSVPLSLKEVAGATLHVPVSVSGSDYELFVQPFVFHATAPSTPPPESKAAAPAKTEEKRDETQQTTRQADPNTLVLCGITSKSRFTYEAYAVSASIVIAVVAVLILAICSWPFLRVVLIGQHQALKVSDVMLLGFSALTAAAIITLWLIDYLAYDRMSKIASSQMSIFARRLEDDLLRDITRARAVADTLKSWSVKATEEGAPASLYKLRLDDLSVKPQPRYVLGDVSKYVYFSFFAWIDRNGRQRYKGAVGSERPLVSVGQRDYFRETLAGRRWNVTDPEKSEAHDFVLESLRSSTTGGVETVLAVPTGLEDLPVFAVTAQMVHVTRPVLPPSYRFAFIDGSGNVIFHSDERRNRNENFFAETDFNRELRSAVSARHEAFVNLHYWGRDQRAYVKPLANLPWSVVVFRDKALLRSVNVETILLTLVLLICNSMLYLVVFAIVVVARPAYRAPSIWPIAQNDDLYRRLVLMYALSILLALTSAFALTTPRALMIGFLAPAQAISATYLVLHRETKRAIYLLVLAIWTVVTLLWAYPLVVDPMMPDLRFVSQHPAITRAVLLILLAVGAFVTIEQTSSFGRLVPKAARWIRYPRTYIAAGLLLLFISSAVPTIAFFKAASRLELEGLIKYSQLALAERIEERINGLDKLNVTSLSVVALRYPIPNFFDISDWCFEAPGAIFKSPNQNPACYFQCEARDRIWISSIFEPLLPQYSDQSVSIRHLHSDRSDDDQWTWCRYYGSIQLRKKVRLAPTTLNKMFAKPPGETAITIRSIVPPLFLSSLSTLPPQTAFNRDRHHDPATTIFRWIRRGVIILIIFAITRLFLWIVVFIARKVFLIDLRRPEWLSTLPLGPTLGDHVFLTHDSPDPAKVIEAAVKRPTFVDVSFASMSILTRDWRPKLIEIDSSAPGRHVRCLDFEFGAGDPAVDGRKLELLEQLLLLPNRRVIIASRVTPLLFLATSADPLVRARWNEVFSSFVWITSEQVASAQAAAASVPVARKAPPFWRSLATAIASLTKRVMTYDASVQNRAGTAAWLKAETAHDPYLRELADELNNPDDRRAALDELRERAHTYYSGLWASCSYPEKLLLSELARHGLLNGKDRKLVRRLVARGLIRRGPNIQIASETLRLFIIDAGENLEREAERFGVASTWDNLRVPLLIVLLSTTLLIFTTQKDLMNLTAGIVTALATGLPAMAKLIGVFTDRRAAAVEART